MPSLLPGASIGPVFWTSKAFSRIPSPEGTLGRRSHLPAGAPALFLGIIPFGQAGDPRLPCLEGIEDRKSTRLELQSLMRISYAVFCLKKKKINKSYNLEHTTISSTYI